MDRSDGAALLESIHPGFFAPDHQKDLPGEICHEMILALDAFDALLYAPELGSGVTFGFFDGDWSVLRQAVRAVDRDWEVYYDGKTRAYCAFLGGKIASFCLLEDMGEHLISGRRCRIAGPGCVGTLPEYRRRGIGLTMVRNATRILRDEGYDYSYIHYTGVAPWYARLGYRTTLRWNRSGPADTET